ncbi:MAG: hypothetical protein R3C14_19585 [Caldilineaceae bacterium]
MSTIPVSTIKTIDADQLLNQMAQLDTVVLERLAWQLNNLIAQRKAPHLPRREAELLQQINRGVPAAVRQRYMLLNEKLLDETLTSEEHQEFGALVEQIEQADVERLQHLIELAQLRNLSLDALMAQLGIQRKRV